MTFLAGAIEVAAVRAVGQVNSLRGQPARVAE